MGEKEQINLRGRGVQGGKGAYIDESTEYVSITGLVRGAVTANLKDSENPAEHPSPAFHSNVSDVKDELERTRRDVSWLRNQEQDAADISELANRVRDELVVLDDLSSNLEVPDDSDMSQKGYARLVAAEGVWIP